MYYCEHCDEPLYSEEAYQRNGVVCCYSCRENRNNIAKYHHAPEPRYFGGMHEYLIGLELEVMPTTWVDRVTNQLVTRMGNHAYLTEDSSLNSVGHEDGFEIVTQPHNYEGIDSMLDGLDGLDIMADNAPDGVCGLHVNISHPKGMHQAELALLVYFVNHQKHNIGRLARRNHSRYSAYVNKLKPSENTAIYTNHYESVHIKPGGIIEFRMFKGSTDKNIIMASVELCMAIVDFAKFAARHDSVWRDIEASVSRGWRAFMDFLSNRSRYMRHLPGYLVEMGYKFRAKYYFVLSDDHTDTVVASGDYINQTWVEKRLNTLAVAHNMHSHYPGDTVLDSYYESNTQRLSVRLWV